VRPTPSRVKAAPYGHDNSLGHYEDGGLPKVLHLRARVGGAIADRVNDYLVDALWERRIDHRDVSYDLWDEMIERAVDYVHNSDMLPRQAARAAVRWLIDHTERFGRNGGVYGA